MRQVCVVPVDESGNAKVPPIEDLHYGDPLAGSFWIIGILDPEVPTVMVSIDTSPEKWAELETDPDIMQVEEL
jgi:hypothetical protein